MNVHFFAEGDETELPHEGDPDRFFQAAAHYEQMWASLIGVVAGLDISLGQLRPFVVGAPASPPKDTGIPGLPPKQLFELDEIHSTEPGHFQAFGGVSDCNTGHLVIDNRTQAAQA